MKITKNLFLLLLHILQTYSGQFSEHSRIFQIKIEESPQNPCQYNSDCEIQCLDGEFTTDSYIESIQSTYDDNDECHSTGVKLIIPTSYFTNKTLKSKWLPVNIIIIDLDVDFNKIGVFEQNAFGANRFVSVKKFVIRNLWPEEILPKWTFNGLSSLEDLHFVNAQLAVGWWNYIITSYALLEFAKNTLNSVTLIERDDSHNKSFLIQSMLGYHSQTLVSMEYVNIKYNLTTINALSFAAIPFVRVLNLSDCYISVIEVDTFDGLSQNLIILNLDRNNLVTLPEGIFMKFSLNSKTELVDTTQTTLSIHLQDNPWHCGCKLLFFQGLLQQYSNFQGDFSCRSPPEIVNYPIEESDFCPYPVTTTPPTDTTETFADNYFEERECVNGDRILIQSQLKQITASVKNGTVFATVKNIDSNLALLWFISNTQLSKNYSIYQNNADIIDCIINLSEEIVIQNLNQGIAYTFCVIKVIRTTVSPFDCISIYLRGDEASENKRNWLSESSKLKVIGVALLSFVISILFGTVVTLVFFKYVNCCDENNSVNQYNESVLGAASNQFIRQNDQPKESQLNEGHIDAMSLETPPPLPPHPIWTVPDGDIYYEIIK